MEIIYTTNISAFVDEKKLQIVKCFASVVLITQVKALRHEVNICTFINVIIVSLINHNKALNGKSGEENMITVALLQATDVFSIISDTLKDGVRKAKKKRMKKVSR